MGKRVVLLESGKYRAKIYSYGAILLWFGTEDKNYVLSYKNLDSYPHDSNYLGKTIGPFANRIANHSFSIDGVKYTLGDNDNGATLHSASSNFGDKLWDVEKESKNSVTLILNSPEEGGFPGEHCTKITYTLRGSTLSLDYEASSSKKCPVYLTNHAYFSLSSSSKDVILTLPSSFFIASDSRLIPLESNPTPVLNTPFDFRKPTRIGERRDGKYDNAFVLDKGDVRAEGDRAIIIMRTDAPGVQVYTGEFLSGEITPFKGLALESGEFPDSPNRADFNPKYTDKDKVFKTHTEYELIEKA